MCYVLLRHLSHRFSLCSMLRSVHLAALSSAPVLNLPPSSSRNHPDTTSMRSSMCVCQYIFLPAICHTLYYFSFVCFFCFHSSLFCLLVILLSLNFLLDFCVFHHLSVILLLFVFSLSCVTGSSYYYLLKFLEFPGACSSFLFTSTLTFSISQQHARLAQGVHEMDLASHLHFLVPPVLLPSSLLLFLFPSLHLVLLGEGSNNGGENARGRLV